MAQLSDAEVREVQSIAAEAMVGDSVRAEDVTAAVDLGDAKDFFCKNWPTIKKVIRFLGDTVGGIAKRVAEALIAAGDFLHGRICNG